MTMNRKEFLQRSALFTLGTQLLPGLLTSCDDSPTIGRRFDVNFDGNVLVIGAGSAGLTAGHVLRQHNIDFQILEASDRFGGRVRRDSSLADFPIDLGAEWLHTDSSVFAEMINDPGTSGDIELIRYRPETMSAWHNDALRKRNFYTNFYAEYKFKSTTWYDFFERYIVPGIEDSITYQSPVVAIDYSGSRVQVTTADDTVYEADKVILTVPLTILKQNRITFDPPLPASKTNALADVEMPDGIKVFIRMNEDFYPDILFDGGILKNALTDINGEKIYYDAAFRKDTRDHVLALFCVGEPATIYAQQDSDQQTLDVVMTELDKFFDGKASRHYQDHVIQNWSKETFIGGSYSHYDSYNRRDDLKAPLDSKIYFAGETYAEEDSIATVHGASLSAFTAVQQVLA